MYEAQRPHKPLTKRPGRPLSNPAKGAKDARLTIQLHAADRAALYRVAEESGMSVASYVAGCIQRDRGFREALEDCEAEKRGAVPGTNDGAPVPAETAERATP